MLVSVRYRILMLSTLVAVAWGLFQGTASAAAPRVVMVAPIEGMVDLGMGPFVERVLDEAQELGAAAVILDINTFGGRVDAAVAIRDDLLASSVPTVAFINPRAISAGALIALAANQIAVSTGATIGAATPVMLGQPGQPALPTDEKSVSYVRKEFRATADARGRPGLIAEAMVDSDVEVAGLVDKGKLLTLTTDEALTHAVADLRADDLPALLRQLGWEGAELRQLSMNWAEKLVRWLTHPVLASLLMTLGVLGLVVELRTPGFGVPGLVGFASLAIFFWGHALVELVGWEQIALVIAGLLLLALEVFVIPGFGIAGVAGLVALAAGLTTSLTGAGASLNGALHALGRVALSALFASIASLLILPFLSRLPAGRKLVLGAAIAETPATAGGGRELGRRSLLGAVGTSLSALRPAGIASVNGERVDVVSQGEFVAEGERIEVIRDEGHRVVVRRAAEPSNDGAPA
jgi:membrane-bound serine protease (ClpP class)